MFILNMVLYMNILKIHTIAIMEKLQNEIKVEEILTIHMSLKNSNIFILYKNVCTSKKIKNL